MLAQSFLSADDLKITEPQRQALMKVLVLLETEKLEHVRQSPDMEGKRVFSGHFNMGNWRGKHDCGTVCCIGGTAELVGDVSFGVLYDLPDENPNLAKLFLPFSIPDGEWCFITTAQAATALRSYLTTGDARWDLAVQ